MEPRLPASFSSEPNLVPMIDVLLVLLIIAMMNPGRMVLDAQPASPDSAAEAPPPARRPPPPVLRISSPGRFELDGVRLSAAQLLPALRALAETRTPRVLLISADRHVMFKAVVSAMDAAKGAGMDVVALEPPEAR